MCSNSYRLYIFHLLLLILWSTEGNAAIISEPQENVSRSGNSEMKNCQDKNFQNCPPELIIAAVEYQIIRELQRMIQSNVKGSDEAARALTETETCMKNGMPFPDALHEGLRKMFPNIIGLDDSTSDDGTVVAILLFTNMRKYMQEIYILNLLQQQTKACSSPTELDSSSNKNSPSAGNRRLQQPSLAKQATMQRNSDTVNKSSNKATGEKTLSVWRNGSSQLTTPQLSGAPKNRFEPEKPVSSPSIAPQLNNNLPKSNIGQPEQNILNQPIAPQMANDASSQLGQSNVSNSSTQPSSVAKNQLRSQSNSTQNGESTQANQKLGSNSVVKGSEVLANSNIKSGLADLSSTMNRWALMQESRRRLQATNDSSIKATSRERQSVSKKEEKSAVGDRKVVSETSSQSTSEMPKQNQQVKNLNGEPSIRKTQNVTKKAQSPSVATKGKVTGAVQKNEEMSQLQQVETPLNQVQKNQEISQLQVDKIPSNQSAALKTMAKPNMQNPVNSSRMISESQGALIQDMFSGKNASSGKLGQIPQSGTEKVQVLENTQQLPPKNEVLNQQEKMKELVSSTELLKQRVNGIQQPDGIKESSWDISGGKQLNSQQNVKSQKGQVDGNYEVPSEDMNSEETVVITKRQVFRSETPSARSHTVVLRPAEPVRETSYYENGGYGAEEYPSYGGSNYEGMEYGARGRNGYEGAIEKGYGLGQGYDGIEYSRGEYEGSKGSSEGYQVYGKNMKGQPWSKDASAGAFNEGSEFAVTPKSDQSLSWVQQKPISLDTRLGGVKLAESEENTTEEHGGSSNDSQSIDNLIKSMSQPEDQKWQRRVFKVVEKSRPTGEIIRTVSKSGNWSSKGFEDLTQQLKSNKDFGQQSNNIVRMVDEINKDRQMPIINADKPRQMMKPNTEQIISFSSSNDGIIPIAGLQKNMPTGRLIFGRSGFVPNYRISI